MFSDKLHASFFLFFYRRYVPEVATLPQEYIFEPWKAPLKVQERAKCIIGRDYPKRIVIHEEVSRVNCKVKVLNIFSVFFAHTLFSTWRGRCWGRLLFHICGGDTTTSVAWKSKLGWMELIKSNPMKPDGRRERGKHHLILFKW